MYLARDLELGIFRADKRTSDLESAGGGTSASSGTSGIAKDDLTMQSEKNFAISLWSTFEGNLLKIC